MTSEQAKQLTWRQRSTFFMHVDLSNAAFEDNDELPRILRNVADAIDKLKNYPFALYDVNGNKVGEANVIE